MCSHFYQSFIRFYQLFIRFKPSFIRLYQVSHDHESFLRFKTWFFDDALRLIFNQCLSWLGMDGEACLLRAVCEVGAAPEHEDGLMGDAVTTLLTATNTYTSITNPSQHANQYAEAQLTGQVQYINLTRSVPYNSLFSCLRVGLVLQLNRSFQLKLDLPISDN